MRGSGHRSGRSDVGAATFRVLPVDLSVTRKSWVYVPPALYDVPYVPTQDAVAREMLVLAGVTAADTVYDLGCGDGRIVIAAAREFGASGVGVDIDPARIAEAVANAQKAGVSNRVRFVRQSFFEADFADATVVAIYLLPEINQRLRPRLLSGLRPGSRIVANHFGLGDWRPDETVTIGYRNLYRWTVPAAVTGRWRCVVNGSSEHRHVTLDLERRYQFVVGSARPGRYEIPIESGRIEGQRLTLAWADGTRIEGIVDGPRLRGRLRVPGREAVALGGLRC